MRMGDWDGRMGEGMRGLGGEWKTEGGRHEKREETERGFRVKVFI